MTSRTPRALWVRGGWGVGGGGKAPGRPAVVGKGCDGSVGGEQITSTKRNNKPKKWCFGPISRVWRKASEGSRQKKKITKEGIPQTWKSGSLKDAAAFSHGPGSQRGHGSRLLSVSPVWMEVRSTGLACPPPCHLPALLTGDANRGRGDMVSAGWGILGKRSGWWSC